MSTKAIIVCLASLFFLAAPYPQPATAVQQSLDSRLTTLENGMTETAKGCVMMVDRIKELERRVSSLETLIAAAAAAGAKNAQADGQAQVCEIKGTWHGWRGKTVFQTTDGRAFQQARARYTSNFNVRPRVVFFEDEIGQLMAWVHEEEEAVPVKQIK